MKSVEFRRREKRAERIYQEPDSLRAYDRGGVVHVLGETASSHVFTYARVFEDDGWYYVVTESDGYHIYAADDLESCVQYDRLWEVPVNEDLVGFDGGIHPVEYAKRLAAEDPRDLDSFDGRAVLIVHRDWSQEILRDAFVERCGDAIYVFTEHHGYRAHHVDDVGCIQLLYADVPPATDIIDDWKEETA